MENKELSCKITQLENNFKRNQEELQQLESKLEKEKKNN
jgi:hypothetical protein